MLAVTGTSIRGGRPPERLCNLGATSLQVGDRVRFAEEMVQPASRVMKPDAVGFEAA